MNTHATLLSIVVGMTVLLQVSLVDAEAESARPADAFVDYVGVNTHLGYSDTTYGDYEVEIKPPKQTN
jgi:hypothetical protein